MRNTTIGILAATATLAACVAEPTTTAAPSAPPASFRPGQNEGQQAATIFRFCSQEADRQCPNPSIRCDAFVRSYVRTCMAQLGAPADYIMGLAR